jgi:hypothetical protein
MLQILFPVSFDEEEEREIAKGVKKFWDMFILTSSLTLSKKVNHSKFSFFEKREEKEGKKKIILNYFFFFEINQCKKPINLFKKYIN